MSMMWMLSQWFVRWSVYLGWGRQMQQVDMQLGMLNLWVVVGAQSGAGFGDGSGLRDKSRISVVAV